MTCGGQMRHNTMYLVCTATMQRTTCSDEGIMLREGRAMNARGMQRVLARLRSCGQNLAA